MKNTDTIFTQKTTPLVSADSLPEAEASKQKEKLRRLVTQSNRVLFTAAAVFPFDFFPTHIVIDELKVTILENYFFSSQTVRSVQIRNILNVIVQSSVLFATLIIEGSGIDPITVKYLTKQDAAEAQKIIQGLIIGERKNIDFSQISLGYVKKTVGDIGSVTTMQ